LTLDPQLSARLGARRDAVGEHATELTAKAEEEALVASACARCGKQGHASDSCPKPIVCDYCREEGHKHRRCPKRAENMEKYARLKQHGRQGNHNTKATKKKHSMKLKGTSTLEGTESLARFKHPRLDTDEVVALVEHYDHAKGLDAVCDTVSHAHLARRLKTLTQGNGKEILEMVELM